jgi:integrase
MRPVAPFRKTLAPPDFERVVQHLPQELAEFARFVYLSGWRTGEVRRLTWSDVDRAAGR